MFATTQYTGLQALEKPRALCRHGSFAPIAPLDILLKRVYVHLECLLKKSASVSSCCKGRWTC